MYVLGIESSCDETAASVVNGNGEVLSSLIYSQLDEHAPYAGVVPEIAARAHLDKVDTLVAAALKEAGISFDDLDAVAAAAGPGLIGGLMVGVMTAKAIALVHDIPFLAINHLEGHILIPRQKDPHLSYPYLSLLTSGGHCQCIVAEELGYYRYLGGTIDDAAGEAFDKAAKMMRLGYPGGPKIEEYAKKGDPTRFKLPRPLKGRPGCDFSFSGLKTAMRHAIEGLHEGVPLEDIRLSEEDKADLSASFQQAVCDSLANRVKNAIAMAKDSYPGLKHLVVAGGVAANGTLRAMLTDLADKNDLTFVAPAMSLCTDNAAMIAWAGMERFRMGYHYPLSFKPRPRWPLEELNQTTA